MDTAKSMALVMAVLDKVVAENDDTINVLHAWHDHEGYVSLQAYGHRRVYWTGKHGDVPVLEHVAIFPKGAQVDHMFYGFHLL